MTNILLNTDLLGDSIGDQDIRSGKRLNLIREEANRLSRLIENVPTFSRRERKLDDTVSPSQPLQLQPCDLSSAVNDALSNSLPLFREARLK